MYYLLLDSDDEVNRDAMFSNILQMNELNGELVTVPLFFTVNTVYGETKYVGDKENWTVEEMIEHWEKMPDNALFNGSNTRDTVYREIVRPALVSYVDIEKGTSALIRRDSLER